MGDSDRPILRVVCGPTAAGKTRAAVACARLASIVVISADSRQVYRGFDIGTAKPTPAERAAVPHAGLDALAPTERASAAWWAAQADGWIRAAIAAGRTPLVVGGTGLYLRALFDGLFAEPPMDPEARRALAMALAPLPVEELRRRVTALDPARAHLGRTQLLRAIEVATLTGRRVSDLHREQRPATPWRARYLVVDPGAALVARIDARVEAMLADGWADEVRGLARAVPAEAPAWNASGYRTIHSMVAGELTRAQARERVIIETRQYAKRQRTWFRHQLTDGDVQHLDPRRPEASAALAAWFTAPAERGAR